MGKEQQKVYAHCLSIPPEIMNLPLAAFYEYIPHRYPAKGSTFSKFSLIVVYFPFMTK
jgi:hypothetical protein